MTVEIQETRQGKWEVSQGEGFVSTLVARKSTLSAAKKKARSIATVNEPIVKRTFDGRETTVRQGNR